MRSLALVFLCALPAAAEVQLQSISWRVARKDAGAVAELSELPLRAKGAGVDGRLFARVKFLNRGAGHDALLLRYSLAGKIAVNGAEPALVVPFVVDEKRVPKVSANAVHEIDVDVTTHVNLYLRRLARDGIPMRELKLHLMVSPRKGDKAVQQIESSLPVSRT